MQYSQHGLGQPTTVYCRMQACISFSEAMMVVLGALNIHQNCVHHTTPYSPSMFACLCLRLPAP
jgi:hypothetical protein